MNDGEIHYSLSGLKDLRELLQVVHEIQAETGMLPDVVKYRNDHHLKYNRNDVHLLERGEISEEMYISKNILAE